MRVKVTEKGLLIPREVAERVLAGSGEAEVIEEPGRLLVKPADNAGGRAAEDKEDPILKLGRDPVRTGVRDGSEHHDRYLYTGD